MHDFFSMKTIWQMQDSLTENA